MITRRKFLSVFVHAAVAAVVAPLAKSSLVLRADSNLVNLVIGGAGDESYLMFAHPDVANDIRNLPGFVKIADYGSKRILSDMEFGSFECPVRFIEGSYLPTTTALKRPPKGPIERGVPSRFLAPSYQKRLSRQA